ncbi:hypothetical protein I8F73_05795 [Enterococcus faecalis]|nr:hypothetical protein [Enterococcus faecalis]
MTPTRNRKAENLAKSGKEKKDKEQRIYEQLFASEYWKSGTKIGTTLSNEFELDTADYPTGEKEQRRVVVPKTLPKRQMAFYEMDEHTPFLNVRVSAFSSHNQRSFYLPEMIDLLIVPGIIYNRAGYRIGFGAVVITTGI